MIKKKIIIVGVLAFSLAFQTGCVGKQNEDLKSNKNINQETTQGSIDDDKNKETKDIMDEFDSLAQEDNELGKMVKFINENISLVSKEDASIMINELANSQKDSLPKLEDKFYLNDVIQKKINDIYEPGFGLGNIDDINDKELKDLLTETRDYGYKVETAEGMYFPIINYEFYKSYSSYLTPDIKEYIDIMATESDEVPAKDAALVIGWDKVIERALKQEQFIKQYEDYAQIGDIKQLYKKYVTFALFGLNNTPLFSYDSKVIKDNAKNVYTKAIESNKDSEFLDIIEKFMDILKENNYKLTDEADKYRKSVVESELLTLGY